MGRVQNRRCDLLVVGAGPAGASAAREAAGRGLDVLMVESRRQVGVPVRCAEHIPAPLIGEIGLGRPFVVQGVTGIRTLLPGGDVTETAAPGFMVHRDKFDQALASAAVSAGAVLLRATRALTRNGEERVIVKGADGKQAVIRARVIIGADGPRSTVGRWVGAVNRHLIPAVQARVRLTRPMAHTEVYLDPAFYAGYGWLFPKGPEANVGIGMKRQRPGGNPSLKQLLLRFLSRLVSEGKICDGVSSYTAGLIPAEPVRKAVYGNVMLAGDAAGHAHPITGAGIFPAVTAGRLAGKWAARAIRQGNSNLLNAYDDEWRDLMERTLAHGYRQRRLMEENWDDFDRIIPSCWVAYRQYYADI